MKRSQKILAMITGAFMLVFVVSLFILREEASEAVARYRLETGFQPVEVGEFERLDFGPGWEVTVSGGLGTYVSMKQDDHTIPTVENVNGTLVFRVNADSSNNASSVRIMVKNLKSIKAAKGTSIELLDLDLDSLSVVLENTESFSGINTNIKHLSMYTSGEVALEFSQID